MRLRTTITLIFFTVILLAGIAATYMSYLNGKEIITEQVYAQLETTAESRANHIKTFLREHGQHILTFADDIVFRELLIADKSSSDYSEKFERANKQINSIAAIDYEINEIFVLDSDGKIAATSHTLEEIGADFSEDVYFLKGKNGLYIRDAYYDEDLKEKSIGMSAPILDEKTGEVKGVLIIEISLKELAKITTDRVGLGETGEVYLVNKENKLLTPSRFMENSILVQNVDTINTRNCLDEVERDSPEHVGHEQVEVFLNYRGEKVLGTQVYIPEMQWCLLAEIDKAEVLGEVKDHLLKSFIIISIIIIFLTTLAGFFVGNWIEKVYLKKKRKRRSKRVKR